MPIARLADVQRALRRIPLRVRPPGVRARARAEALAMLETEPLVSPALGYALWPAREAAGGAVELGEEVLHAPQLVLASPGLTAVGVAVCTLGEALENRVEALFARRRRLVAFELDALGNDLLAHYQRIAAARMEGLARRRRLCTGIELSPGDDGFGLEQQHAVLRLAEGFRHGISITRTGMLKPAKSLSFVIAFGPSLAKPLLSRCERCGSNERCRHRAK